MFVAMDIVSVQAVAYWSFSHETESSCAICRNQLAEVCIDCCIAGCIDEKVAGVCELIWGACGHAFHAHCLVRFLETRSTCPLGK
jgi:RING-box protein 1